MAYIQHIDNVDQRCGEHVLHDTYIVGSQRNVNLNRLHHVLWMAARGSLSVRSEFGVLVSGSFFLLRRFCF